MNKRKTVARLKQIHNEVFDAYCREREKSNNKGIVTQREHILGATLDYVNSAFEKLRKL
jgi:hypothetical protein